MSRRQSLIQFDVYLLEKPQPPQKGDEWKLICELEDGYAAFIEPLFRKLNEEAERTIVFIDWAHFGKDDLKLLSQLVSESRQRMKVKPERWDVLLGRDGYKKAIYAKVTTFKMNKLLDAIDVTIREAKTNNRYVSFNFWGGGG